MERPHFFCAPGDCAAAGSSRSSTSSSPPAPMRCAVALGLGLAAAAAAPRPSHAQQPSFERIDPPATAGTGCGRGAPFHFFFRPGTVNKLVIDFEGGGGCWDALTCLLPVCVFGSPRPCRWSRRRRSISDCRRNSRAVVCLSGGARPRAATRPATPGWSTAQTRRTRLPAGPTCMCPTARATCIWGHGRRRA
jgi:hypothetical protein